MDILEFSTSILTRAISRCLITRTYRKHHSALVLYSTRAKELTLVLYPRAGAGHLRKLRVARPVDCAKAQKAERRAANATTRTRTRTSTCAEPLTPTTMRWLLEDWGDCGCGWRSRSVCSSSHCSPSRPRFMASLCSRTSRRTQMRDTMWHAGMLLYSDHSFRGRAPS